MTPSGFLRGHGMMLVAGIALLSAMGALTIALFLRSSHALESQMRETLQAAAVAAALSIDGDDLASIRGPDDLSRPEFREIASRLRGLIEQVPRVRFAYILRRTAEPDVLEFVVDGDALAPLSAVDRDGSGTVDPDEEPALPGDRYDVSDIPALQDDAFLRPTTDAEITTDQWGELLSGYAPIYSRSTGGVSAVLGIDMDAQEFLSHTRSILSPLGVALILLLTGLLAAGVGLLAESRQMRLLAGMNAERSGLLQLTFHQLGEPITILQWGLETLEDAKNDPALLGNIFDENLADMREGVRRLSSIIDTLQEAEKVELGAFKNKPVHQSIRRIVEEAALLVAPVESPERARLELDVADEEYAFDPHLLTIVLRRLLENAFEFSRPPHPVRVRTYKEGSRLCIDVADHGCGISAADLPRMFEKYRRASNARTLKPDGNGLGLYICKGIVELMGGALLLRSVEGVGSVFTVRLPVSPKKSF